MTQEQENRIKEIAKERRTAFAYIPRQLLVDQKPEYAVFPLNVLFAAYRNENDKIIQGHALYEPDLSSYDEQVLDDNSQQRAMMYWNKYNRATKKNDFLAIMWFSRDSSYRGVKIVGGQTVFDIRELDWETFFIHLTSKGLYNSEACMFGPVNNENEKL